MSSSKSKRTLKVGTGWLALACLAASVSVQAAVIDGSQSLICAPVEAQDCAPDEGCDAATPRQIGAPAFLRVDFKQQMVVGPKRSTPIRLMEANDQQIVLMGTELGHAWTIALNKESGDMSATLADRDGAFVLFGSCIAAQ